MPELRATDNYVASQPAGPAPISTAPAAPKNPAWMFYTGWVMTILPVLGLVMSAVMKFLKPPDVVEGFGKLGWPDNLAFGLGVLEVVCTVLYVIPQTAVLGAVLLTGYLGGATATHVRVGDPFGAPIIMGVLVWLGLFLREPRLRQLLPLRRPNKP